MKPPLLAAGNLLKPEFHIGGADYIERPGLCKAIVPECLQWSVLLIN